MKNYYQILGLPNFATLEEIKSAYIKLSLTWHPDKAQSWLPVDKSEDLRSIFVQISEAYETLTNPAKKDQYNANLSFFQKFPPTAQELSEQKKFIALRDSLKKIYEEFTKKKNDPGAYLSELQKQLTQLQQENKKLLLSLEENTKSNQAQATQLVEARSQIRKLTESNAEIKFELKSQIEKYSALNSQFKLIESHNIELQEQLKSFKKENNASMNDVAMVDAPIEDTKMKPAGLQAVHKIYGKLITGEVEFYSVRLAFTNEKQAKAFKAKCEDKSNIDSFALDSGTCVKFPEGIRQDLHVLTLRFINCEAHFQACKQPEKTGELLLQELEKYVDISGVPIESRDYYNNLLNKPKLEAKGLKTIYKLVEKSKHKMQFYGIKLYFEDADHATQFQKVCHHYFDENSIHSFRLNLDTVYNSDIFYKTKVLHLSFVNGKAYYEAKNAPEKIGLLLLQELEKYIDISQVPQEFRYWNYSKPTEAELNCRHEESFANSTGMKY